MAVLWGKSWCLGFSGCPPPIVHEKKDNFKIKVLSIWRAPGGGGLPRSGLGVDILTATQTSETGRLYLEREELGPLRFGGVCINP